MVGAAEAGNTEDISLFCRISESVTILMDIIGLSGRFAWLFLILP